MIHYLDMGNGLASASERLKSTFRIAGTDLSPNEPLPKGVGPSEFVTVFSLAIDAVNGAPKERSELALLYLLGFVDSLINFGHQGKLPAIRNILFDVGSPNLNSRVKLRAGAESRLLAGAVAQVIFS